MPKKKQPSRKKATKKRASTKGPGHTFGKWRVPRDVKVRDSGLVDGEGHGFCPSPDYDPEDGDWNKR